MFPNHLRQKQAENPLSLKRLFSPDLRDKTKASIQNVPSDNSQPNDIIAVLQNSVRLLLLLLLLLLLFGVGMYPECLVVCGVDGECNPVVFLGVN